jgi:amino acid transporter
VNIPAFVVSAVSTGLLLLGIKESKRVMNAVTIVKMCIVLFMIVGGFLLYDPIRVSNQPFTPYGISGVFRGATTSFFGYLGYDEICCVAGEAKHPARDLPRAVLGTLCTVTLCYVLAAVALTGMLPYSDISATAGFPDAFHQRQWEWAAQITAAGEVATLPVVVLISLMAQPRLTFSMSMDGLLPSIFGHVDTNGNMLGGTFVSGTAMTIIATFIPFTYLDDLISAGILLAFSMTNACLVLLRCQSPINRPYQLEHLLVYYNALCFTSSMLWSHEWSYMPFQFTFAAILSFATMYCFVHLCRSCHLSAHFGGSILAEGEYTHDRHVTAPGNLNGSITNGATTAQQKYFTTPLVPYLPCLGMAVNWYLIAQLDVTGIFFLLLYLGIISTLYLFQCAPNSIGHVRNWNRGTYESVRSTTTIPNPQHLVPDGEYSYDDGENELRPMPARVDGMVRSSSMT